MTDDMVGVVIDEQWTIDSRLAVGGMATVYLAQDLRHQRRVAIKFLHNGGQDARSAQRFFREVEVAAGLNHPHILPLFASGEHDGHLYYVMPFMEGQTLRARLDEEKQLPVADAVRLATEIADALAHAHRAGITHRDIKPENILLEGGHAIVADFGLASAPRDASLEAGLTVPGTTLGTPLYMSPEQAAGERVDARSDVYSLGCVLYEMLTGLVPLTGPTHQVTVFRRRSETPAAISSFRRRIGPKLERAVRTALEPNPADRFQTAAAFRDALELAGPRSRSDALGEGHSRLVLRAAGIVGALVVFGLVGFAVWNIEGARAGSDAEAPVRRLAVLPFADPAAGGSDGGFLAAGVAEDLRDALSRIEGLTVASLESSELASREPMARAGETLGVEGLIQGTVTRSADELRIGLRLTHARLDRQIWGRTFTGRPSEIFSLTSAMTDSLVRVLDLDADPSPSTASRTTDVGTYDIYLRARFAAGDRTREGLARAVDFYRRAISRDSLYAPAWAGLASALALTGVYEYRPWKDFRTEADRAASIAIRLDSTSAEAHRAQGLLLDYRFAWEESKAAYRRAIRHNPNDAEAFHWYAVQNVLSGDRTDAPRLIAEARRLNPLSFSINVASGWIDYYLGNVTGAIQQFEASREMEENAWIALVYLALAYGDAGRAEQGLATLDLARELNPDSPMLVPVRARLLALAGDRGQALQVLAESAGGAPAPTWMSIAYLSLGMEEEALSWLERGYGQSPESLIEINTFWFDPLRNHPRFRALVSALHTSSESGRSNSGLASSPPIQEDRMAVRAMRLMFRYENKAVQALVKSQVVEATAPPLESGQAFTPDVFRGSWFEILGRGDVTHSRNIRLPIFGHVEVPSGDAQRPLGSVQVANPSGYFTVLIPLLQGATDIRFFGSDPFAPGLSELRGSFQLPAVVD